MPSLVVLHVSLCSEPLAAVLGAIVRALIGMNQRVNFQVLLFAECPETVRKWTFEGLSAFMQVAVGF